MKFIRPLLFIAALAAVVFSQSPSKVLKQAEIALGGAKVFRSVRSTVRSGSIKRISDSAVGRYVVQTSQPNLLNISYDVGGFEAELGYNGRSGWSRNSRDGLHTLTGKDSSDFQAIAVYRNHLWLNYKNDKSRIVSGGQAPIADGRTANVLKLKTRKGVEIRLYFDTLTALLVREEIPSGDKIEIWEYSDHRDVNGLKEAFMSRLTVGQEAFEIRHHTVRHNDVIARSEFDFPVVSNDPLPEIPALLAELSANEERVEALLDNYSYTEKNVRREMGKDGVLRESESQTFQLSFYKGNRIRRLVEKNGRPLSEKDQTDADKDAAKQAEEIEKRLAKEDRRLVKLGSGGAPADEGRRISIAELLRASKLLNPRRERFRGRDVIVFDFEPDPGFDTHNARSMLKFFGKTAGVMWIDEKDKQVARIEAVLFESFKMGGGVLAKLQKGASFTLEKERVGDEVWLPSQADINLSVRLLLVKGINVNQSIRSYDYRRFETEVRDAKVGDPAMP